MGRRTCSICDEPHLALGFCRKHYRRFTAYGDPLAVSPRDLLPAPAGLRTCTSCLEPKELSEFGNCSRYRDGKLRICKECMKARTRAWRSNNRDHAIREGSRRNALSKYGPEGEAAWLRIEAGEPCDACGERRSRMAIDHDHKTGRVRGILCSPCNTALGLLQEDPDRFAALLSYAITTSKEESDAYC